MDLGVTAEEQLRNTMSNIIIQSLATQKGGVALVGLDIGLNEQH